MQLPLHTLQGREKAAIIFCAVCSNSRGDLGFVKDERRLNVAMTRAKHVLLLVGNQDVLLQDSCWQQWVEQAKHITV